MNRQKPTTEQTRNKAPREQCGDCKAWQSPAGCGWLDSGIPCRHTVERHRFDAIQQATTGVLHERDI